MLITGGAVSCLPVSPPHIRSNCRAAGEARFVTHLVGHGARGVSVVCGVGGVNVVVGVPAAVMQIVGG